MRRERGSRSRAKRFPPRQRNEKAGGGGGRRGQDSCSRESQSTTMVFSAVGGTGGSVSAAVPQSRGRRQRAWILTLLSGTRVGLFGGVSSPFGAHPSGSNTLCKRRVLPTNPSGPGGSDGWSYCFCSLLFKTQAAWLFPCWEACPGIPAEA